MPSPSDRIMFEIYREADYDRRFRVVFFTELDEHNKEREINRAMAGEHFYDGFIKEISRDEGKRLLAEILRKLNDGERMEPAEVESRLASVLA